MLRQLLLRLLGNFIASCVRFAHVFRYTYAALIMSQARKANTAPAAAGAKVFTFLLTSYYGCRMQSSSMCPVPKGKQQQCTDAMYASRCTKHAFPQQPNERSAMANFQTASR